MVKHVPTDRVLPYATSAKGRARESGPDKGADGQSSRRTPGSHDGPGVCFLSDLLGGIAAFDKQLQHLTGRHRLGEQEALDR